VSVHVFVGPTLSQDEVRTVLEDAEVFGPAAFGDVYRSAKAKVQAIAIIDGYFERVPAVWHKEILWAMSEGVHVFGASSMGALRAAELADFGMQGLGAIYEAYRNGSLEDDDEVTIAHGAPEDGFKPISEAMVNLRATVVAAVKSGVVTKQTGDLLLTLAKSRFYAERSLAAAMQDAASAGVAAAELSALRAWLPNGRVDQKAADARLLLRHIREWRQSKPKPLRVNYRLEPTDAWLEAIRLAEASGDAPHLASNGGDEALEEELKLAGLYASARDRGAARAAAIDVARRAGFRPDTAALAHAAETLRRDLGLVRREDFEAWRVRERIDDASLVQLFEDQAQALWAQPQTEAAARAFLADGLRVTSQYGRFAEKAAAKARVLAELGPRGPALRDFRMDEPALWGWYFESKLGRPVPSDLHTFAHSAGFADTDELRAAVLRELYFERAGQGNPETRE